MPLYLHGSYSSITYDTTVLHNIRCEVCWYWIYHWTCWLFQGLVPRAKLLLTLGGTFFLAFWPLIIVTVGLTLALYFVSYISFNTLHCFISCFMKIETAAAWCWTLALTFVDVFVWLSVLWTDFHSRWNQNSDITSPVCRSIHAFGRRENFTNASSSSCQMIKWKHKVPLLQTTELSYKIVYLILSVNTLPRTSSLAFK